MARWKMVWPWVLAFALTGIVLSAQAGPTASDAWVAEPPAGATAADAYALVENPSMYEVFIVSVTADVARSVEIVDGPADAAKAVRVLAVPAYGRAELKPGAQFVVAVNPGPPFAVRDSRGVSRSDLILKSLAEWAKSRQGSLHYCHAMCSAALDRGILPHTNAGILSREEMEYLRGVNASMGLMLETTARVPTHRRSPGKDPEVRIRMIEEAGQIRIPFTTGILVGIGETMGDREESLALIRDLHRRYGHIQEVIVQNFCPKEGTPMARSPGVPTEEICVTICLDRDILPRDVAVQIPPNLADAAALIPCGVDDLGGVSPVTPDYINPEHPWPALEELKGIAGDRELRERLCIYPQYMLNYTTVVARTFKRTNKVKRADGTTVVHVYPGLSKLDALAAGYKLGFTGGTDNHCGRPAFCFAWQEMNRGRLPLHCQSLTGVWTDRIERRSVWKALYDRHTWAAWDTRALVHFEVNGAAAGADLTVQQGKPLQARVKISAEDSLQSLEVISEKAVCWSGSVDALDCDVKIDLAPATRTTHFYLRGLLRNGGILYASPVFVTVRK